MKPTAVFWLPGGINHPQHMRLRVILAPLCTALAKHGFTAALRSIRSDAFSAREDAAHIWLATDLGERPPCDGINILWFLSQMKVTTLPVLLAHDAIVTASPDHATFLSGWLGNRRHIGVVGWPVAPPVLLPRKADHGPVLELTAMPEAEATTEGGLLTQLEDLPAEAAALQRHLQGYGTIISQLPLRERMCGFYRYEEVVALLSGCRVQSLERRGLPMVLERLIAWPGATPCPVEIANRACLALLQDHDPARIAAGLVAAITAAKDRHASQDQRRAQQPERRGTMAHDARVSAQDEWGAFSRDASYILDHPALPDLIASADAELAVDLGQPWDIIARQRIALDAAPRPWTDLSLLRCICDAVQQDAVQLSPQDRAQIAAIVQILQTQQPNQAQGDIALGALPSTPWAGVATASRAPQRIFLDQSRALNGHNIYRFGQMVGKPKTLGQLLAPATREMAPPPQRMAVVLHGYYTDIARDMLACLTPALRDCPIFVTTDTPQKADDLRSILTRQAWPRVEIRQIENIGRDIYPKLMWLGALRDQFDMILFLHTKKSPHSPSLRDWGKDAVARLAGSPDAIAQVTQAFAADAELGIIYPDPPKILYPAMSWLRNLRLAEFLGAKIGLGALPPSESLDFPAGSMFWAKTDAIAAILDLALTPACFAAEAGQEDGTLAHVIERMIGAVAQAQGYRLARI